MNNVILSGIFWSLTYIILIIYSKKYRHHAIPLTAMCLNFAWETVALFRFVLDGDFFVAFYVNLVLVIRYIIIKY